MPKRPIREQLLVARKQADPEECRRLGEEIQSRFMATALFQQARSVALYSPILNEVPTDLVAAECRRHGKILAYPKVVGDEMVFVAVGSPDDLRPGSFGVLEPTGSTELAVASLDLLIVPGVAFDLAGHRLGYGKGYYDRVLDGCPATVAQVGFAYEFQVVVSLPIEGHDRPLTELITERRLLSFA